MNVNPVDLFELTGVGDQKAIQQAFREVSDLLSARTSLAAQLQAQQEVEKVIF